MEEVSDAVCVMLTRLSLRLRVFLIFAALLAGLVLSLGIALFVVWRRLYGTAPDLTPTLVAAGAAGLCGIVLLVFWVWHLFDQHVARPIEALAGGLRVGAEPGDVEARYLADLAPAAQFSVKVRTRSEEALAEAVQDRLTVHAREKAMLEAVLGDIGAIALMTNAEGRVIFFNAAAQAALPGLVLGSALARHLRPAALSAAERRLAAAGGVTEISVTTREGSRLSGSLRLSGDERVLILRPTDQQQRASAAERLRRHAATLVPLLDSAQELLPPQVHAAIRAEGSALISALREMDAGPTGGQVSAQALAASVEGVRLGRIDELCIAAEAGTLAALLTHLVQRLDQSGRAPELEIAAEQDEALISLRWAGAPLSMAVLDDWLGEAPDADRPGISGAALVTELGSGLWTEPLPEGGCILMPMPVRAGQCDLPTQLTYRATLGGDELLSQMTFVVFDTETTGLAMTDGIVQLAGLRIMDGRLTGERYDTLVNPGCAIPASATAIHGITDAMVRDAPRTTAALNAFRHFSEDAILVAHNAAFDMGLLRAAQGMTGIEFPNRVLDTILLSAMLWGQGAPHSLDALAERLGVVIAPGARHTALGDAEATAQILLRMIPALEAKGLGSLDAIYTEARRHRALFRNSDFGGMPRGAPMG